MTIRHRYVLQSAAILLVAVLVGCKDKNAGGPTNGQQGPPGTLWVAGLCNLPSAGNCTTANTCTATACNVGVSTDGTGAVNMTLNGQALTSADKIVCAAQGAAVTWSNTPPPGQHFSFLLDFGNVAPITNSMTYGNGSDTAPATYTVASANGCYKYNVKICPVPSSAGPNTLACGEI